MHDQASKLRKLAFRDELRDSNRQQPLRIALTGAKGGVGTTTIAINCAIAMQQMGRSVLLVDADPSRGDIATMCDLAADYGLEDVLQSRRDWKSVEIVGPAGISIIASHSDVAPDYQYGGPVASVGPQRRQQFARKFDSGLSSYDVILIDTGCCPMFAETIWPLCDQSVLLSRSDHVSLKNAYCLVKALYSRHAMTPRLLINDFGRLPDALDTMARLQASCQRFLDLDLTTLPPVPRSEAMQTSLSINQMAVCARPQDAASEVIEQIAKQLMGDTSADSVRRKPSTDTNELSLIR